MEKKSLIGYVCREWNHNFLWGTHRIFKNIDEIQIPETRTRIVGNFKKQVRITIEEIE